MTYVNPFLILLPASYLCHRGLGWSFIIVRSIFCQPLIMTLWLYCRSKFPQGPYLLRAREGGLQLIFLPISFIRVTIYLATFPHSISRGQYLPRGPGGGGLQLVFQPFILSGIYPAALSRNISRGHYLPCKIYCLVLACLKIIFHIRPLSVWHNISYV